jgi:hypothetical protein
VVVVVVVAVVVVVVVVVEARSKGMGQGASSHWATRRSWWPHQNPAPKVKMLQYF